MPVPSAVALCDDPDVLGAPFYLMDFVDGIVLDKPDLLAGLGRDQAAVACEMLVDTLVALHEVDYDAVGLGEFGRPDGFLARQVRRWTKQWEASETRPLDVLGRLVERLTTELPEPSAPGIVHGDYRLTNVMFTPSVDRISAVLDWEMATLGDPLTDVGLLVVYQDICSTQDLVMPEMTPERGFWTGAQAVEHYAERSSRDTSRLDWYIAFGYFKLAVVAEGIHHRYLAGKTVGEGFDHFGAAVPVLLERGLEAHLNQPTASQRSTDGVRPQRAVAGTAGRRAPLPRRGDLPRRAGLREAGSRQPRRRHTVPHAGGAGRAEGERAQARPVEPVPARRRARRGADGA